MDSTSKEKCVSKMTTQEFAQHLKDKKEELFNQRLPGRSAGCFSKTMFRGYGSAMKRRHTP